MEKSKILYYEREETILRKLALAILLLSISAGMLSGNVFAMSKTSHNPKAPVANVPTIPGGGGGLGCIWVLVTPGREDWAEVAFLQIPCNLIPNRAGVAACDAAAIALAWIPPVYACET